MSIFSEVEGRSQDQIRFMLRANGIPFDKFGEIKTCLDTSSWYSRLWEDEPVSIHTSRNSMNAYRSEFYLVPMGNAQKVQFNPETSLWIAEYFFDNFHTFWKGIGQEALGYSLGETKEQLTQILESAKQQLTSSSSRDGKGIVGLLPVGAQ